MVIIKNQGEEISGMVKSVEKSDQGQISVIVDGKDYDPSTIVKVSLPNQ